jgi:hypothetical protein
MAPSTAKPKERKNSSARRRRSRRRTQSDVTRFPILESTHKKSMSENSDRQKEHRSSYLIIKQNSDCPDS